MQALSDDAQLQLVFNLCQCVARGHIKTSIFFRFARSLSTKVKEEEKKKKKKVKTTTATAAAAAASSSSSSSSSTQQKKKPATQKLDQTWFARLLSTKKQLGCTPLHELFRGRGNGSYYNEFTILEVLTEMLKPYNVSLLAGIEIYATSADNNTPIQLLFAQTQPQRGYSPHHIREAAVAATALELAWGMANQPAIRRELDIWLCSDIVGLVSECLVGLEADSKAARTRNAEKAASALASLEAARDAQTPKQEE